MASKYSINIGVDSFESLLNFLGVSVGCSFHQLFVNVSGDVRLEQLFEQGTEIF